MSGMAPQHKLVTDLLYNTHTCVCVRCVERVLDDQDECCVVVSTVALCQAVVLLSYNAGGYL